MSAEIKSPEIFPVEPVEEELCRELGGRAIDALLITPLPSPSDTNPPLGPAVIARTAETKGIKLGFEDWNGSFMSQFRDHARARETGAVGDHGNDRRAVVASYTNAHDTIRNFLFDQPGLHTPKGADPIPGMNFSFESIWVGINRAKESGPWQQYINELFDKFEKPPVIGVSVMGPTQVFPALLIFEMAKERWPDDEDGRPQVVTVLGGTHSTLLRKEIIKDPRYTHNANGKRVIDAVLPGHSEDAFVDLIAKVKDNPGEMQNPYGELPHIGNISYPGAFIYHPLFNEEQLKHYDKKTTTLGVQFSRGCPLECAFCSYSKAEELDPDEPLGAFRHQFRPKEAQETLAALVEEYGVRRFSIKDSLFLSVWMKELSELLIEHGPHDIEVAATTKITEGLGKIAPLLAKAGFRTLELGIETIHPEGLKLFNKKHPSTENMEEIIHKLTGSGITVVTNLIFGLPNETEADARKQLAWAKKLQDRARDENHPGAVEFSFNSLDIARETPLSKQMGPGVEAAIAPWAGVHAWDSPEWRQKAQFDKILLAAEMKKAK